MFLAAKVIICLSIEISKFLQNSSASIINNTFEVDQNIPDDQIKRNALQS